MIRYSKVILFCLLGVVAAMASTVVEDSKSRFVMDDVVADVEAHRCMDLDGNIVEGYTFDPEDSFRELGNDLAFRMFRVAVPGNQAPSVTVSKVETKPLGKPFCAGGKLDFKPMKVSAPYLKDGLWMVDIAVPLYEKVAGSIALRKSFRLQVDFPAAGGGVNPGLRAVSRVLNPKAAARFGVAQSGARKALRRAAASELSNTNFLTQIVVGDKNIATNSEDGLYAVPFEQIRLSVQIYERQSDLPGIPIEKLRLYGASPDTLTDVVPGQAQRSPNQLFQIPIEVRDHSGYNMSPNGIFDEGDTLLFVGYGNGFWKRCDSEDRNFDNGKMDYFHSYSPYSFYQHFLLGYSDTGKGMRLSNTLKPPSGAGKDIPWMRYQRAEKDVFLRDTYYGKKLDWEASTGKEWFWFWHARSDTTVLSNMDLSMPQVEKLKGLVDGGKQYVAVSYYPHRSVWQSKIDGISVQETQLLLSGKKYRERMDSLHFSFKVNGKSFEDDLNTLIPGGNFRMDNPGLKSSGNTFELTMLPNPRQYDRFDGYTVAYQWNPSADSSEWLLPGKVSGIINIPVGKTEKANLMKFVNFEPVGLLKIENGMAKDSVSGYDDVRYLLYTSKHTLSPVKVESFAKAAQGEIADLSKINSETQYLIISPSDFISQSVTLGQFRSGGKAVKTIPTTVVSTDNIYRMYTGGSLSPVAIRNYIAYAYSVCPNLKYVLLAGSGHFDYKGIRVQDKNFVPPFEREDLVSEDFYSILDSGEVVGYGDYDVDVAVGRLPVSNAQEYNAYIAKAIEYEQVGSFDHGPWRSTLLLSADDAKNGNVIDKTGHTTYQEEVANMLDKLSAQWNFRWNLKKIYLIDYISDASGQKKEATNDFLNAFNQGTLMTNYFGHGSESAWASEGLLKTSYLPRLSNKGHYTILNSFSCEVGRFETGKVKSLSEELLVAPKAGSIVSVGASRETFGPHNLRFGKTLMQMALGESGITYGEAFLKAKSDVALVYDEYRYNNERYVYFGEPVIQMPNATMKISLDQKLDTLKALDKMKLTGTVSGMSSGIINMSLREGRVNKRLGLQIITDGVEDSIDVIYDGSLIYSEEIPVKGGRFETEFVTPRKINFGDTSAQFFAWAYSQNERGIGRSYINGLKISGMSNYADSINDNVPPVINVQSCFSGGMSTSFGNGQKIRLQSPACLQVVVEDSTALDYREQADEGISIEVEGFEDPYHPSPFIEQTSKRAVFRKSFVSEVYPPGEYVFKVYAQDVLGNSTEKEIHIEITGDLEDGLVDVFNIPNPMGKKGTTFYFKNLAVDRTSTVDIFIYNQNGRLVRVLKNAVSGVTHWMGHDNHGRLLANGLYHYVVRNRVDAAGESKAKTFTKKQKLLISR